MRRFLALAAGLLTVAVLAGCRFETGSDAAYVGTTRISTASVDRVIDTFSADGKPVPAGQRNSARRTVLADLVFVDVARRYAAEHGYPAPTVDYASTAQTFGVPPSDPFARLVAETDAYRNLVTTQAKTAQPTDADLRAIFNAAVAAGLANPSSYQQIKPQLAQIPSLAQGIAVRNALAAAMVRYNVSVNPAYGAVQFPLVSLTEQSSGRSFLAVGLPIRGGASPAVTDVSTPNS